METVYLINNENTPFGFHFVEDSCHSEGYASHLVVEPMSGQIPAKSRWVCQQLEQWLCLTVQACFRWLKC